MESSLTGRVGSLLCALCIGSGVAQGSLPEVGRNYPPAAQAFVEALTQSSQGPDTRSELRDITLRGLYDASDLEVERFLMFLWEVSRWYDLNTLDDVLLGFDKSTQMTQGARLLDYSILNRMPREERKDLYHNVLVSGTVRLRYGTELDRYVAILLASQEGLQELYKPVVDAMDTLPEVVRERLDLKELEWCFRLRDGASDRYEGDMLVLNRFLKLAKGPTGLEQEDYVAIRRVVTKAASSACDRGPMDAFDPAGCQEWRQALSGIASDLRGLGGRWPPSPLVDPAFISRLGDAAR